MVPCGYLPSLRAGRPIISDIGRGLSLGAGRGWMTPLGDLRLATTDVGSITTIIGDGCRDRSQCVRCTRPLWSHGWAEATGGCQYHLVEAPELDGSHWVTENPTFPRTA